MLLSLVQRDLRTTLWRDVVNDDDWKMNVFSTRTPIPDFRDKIEYKKKKKRRLFLVPEKTFHDVESNVVVVIVVVVVVGLRLCFVRIGEPRWISFVGNDTYWVKQLADVVLIAYQY